MLKKVCISVAKAFQESEIDMEYVRERFEKAYEYFFPILDSMYDGILMTLLKVEKMKKMKAFMEEIQELEEEHIKIILGLNKNKRLLEILKEGKTINKFNLKNTFIGQYKINKTNELIQKLKEESQEILKDLDEDDEESSEVAPKPVKSIH
jgi:hypothetical protein